MLMNMKNIKIIVFALAILACASCNKFFEPDLENRIEEKDNFDERSSVYASFMGLYSLLQDVAPHVIAVSELRGDLITPTETAPDDYWHVFRYDDVNDNSVADPAPLYRLVVNCNDFLRNTVEYNSNYPGVITEPVYKQMIAGAVTVRAWAYLNIGKLYGKAAYYDLSMRGETDLNKVRVLSFEQLIPELIHFMNTGVDNVNGMRNVLLNNMFGTTGIWSAVPVSPDAVMMELHLWNKDYESAAKRGINLITGVAIMEAGDNHKNTLSNQFGGKAASLKQWHTLFSESPVAVHAKEGLSMVLYNYNQRQCNPLYSWFSSDPSCDYYMMPTNALVNKYSGADYKQGVNTVKDPRGNDVTINTETGSRTLYKYIKDRDIQKQDAPIYLYRAAEIHLMIAEALSGLGNFEAADAILNEGFSAYWVTGKRYNAPFDAPIYGFEKLKLGQGVRGRLGIPELRSTDKRFIADSLALGSDEYNMRRREVLDSLLVEETAREFAGEGKRWFALMRIARNSDRPELLAKLVSNKFPQAQRQQYYDMLMDRSRWFIDYDMNSEK